jgi:DNA-nicking Smr family endonuclease
MAKPPLHPDWHAATAEVTPLGHAKPNAQALPKMPAPTGPNPVMAAKVMPTPSYHWRATPIPIIANTPQCLAGAEPHIPKKTLKALAAGELLPQLVLDLHGLREGDAWLRLHHFLHQAARTEHGNTPVQVVLVIHGKGRGEGPDKAMGVLKSQMAAQLARHPAVVAFHTAIPKHGGQGATYVLVKSPH